MNHSAEPGKSTDKLPGQQAGDRALDQWRGFALILVLISHGFLHTGRVAGIGRVGVNLFFFISGILVFRSLKRGPQEFWPGTKYFSIRKIRRLIPAKYFYLLCITLFVLIVPPLTFSSDLRSSFLGQLPSCLFYFRNYESFFPGGQQNLTGHLWSLSCEFQFYVLAPFLYFTGGFSAGRRLLVFGTALTFLLITGLLATVTKDSNPYAFLSASWPMMVGFFTEFLRSTFPNRLAPWGKHFLWFGLLSLIALVPTIYLGHKNYVILVGTMLIGGCLGCYLEGIATRGILGNTCYFLGNRTYSIYLWQQPLTLGGLIPVALYPLGSLLSIGVGTILFHFLERPFMTKKRGPLVVNTQSSST